jgi:ABC-type taurine transport system ATPase subunit
VADHGIVHEPDPARIADRLPVGAGERAAATASVETFIVSATFFTVSKKSAIDFTFLS